MEVCTPEEAKELKALLKKSGDEIFIKKAIIEGGMGIRQCLTAFGVRPVSLHLQREQKEGC